MRVLALDLALNRCGWARNYEVGKDSGTWCCPDGHEAERFAAFRTWICSWGNTSYTPQVVVFDSGFGCRGHAARTYYGVRSILLLWCHDNGIDAHAASMPAVRQQLGIAQRGKLPVWRWAAERGLLSGPEPTSTKDPRLDEADALAILEYWVGQR